MTPHILENVSTWSVNISNSPPRDPNDDDDEEEDEEDEEDALDIVLLTLQWN